MRHRNLTDIASIAVGTDLQQSSYLWPTWVLIAAPLLLASGTVAAVAVAAAWWLSVLVWIPFAAAAFALMFRFRRPKSTVELPPSPAGPEAHALR